jgi:hypothetical protein
VPRVEKKALYDQVGITEYWIVDPESRSIEFFALVKSSYRMGCSHLPDAMKATPAPLRYFAAWLFLVLPVATYAQITPTVSESSHPTNSFRMETSLRQPAVSEVNGKVDYLGGMMESAESHNFSGSLTVPLGNHFGFQADALYSRIGGLDFYGGAGHLFWRDPAVGLVGLTGGYLSREGVDTFQVGAEAEYYLGRFTFGLFAGVGSISYANVVSFIDTNPTRFVGRVRADYYPLDDLRVSVSYTTAFEDNLVKGDLEYQTPLKAVALTAEVAAGDHGYNHWLLGVRYYFGGKKSLRDRQRQDDPPGLMNEILHGLGVYGAEFNRKASAYAAAHPGTGSVDGSYGSVFTHGTGPPPIVIVPLPPLPTTVVPSP